MSDDSWAHLLLDDASLMVPHHLDDDNGLYDPTYDPTHQTTSEASTASTATPSMLTEPIESTSQYLVRMSCEFIDSINNRDWANAERLACIVDHTCFTARLTEFPEVDSWWKHLETYVSLFLSLLCSVSVFSLQSILTASTPRGIHVSEIAQFF